jgi:glutaredoxin 3
VTHPVITIYSTAICPYCVAAKNFLKSKGLSWTSPHRHGARRARSHGAIDPPHQRPADLRGRHHVGGYDDMMALHRSGGSSRCWRAHERRRRAATIASGSSPNSASA